MGMALFTTSDTFTPSDYGLVAGDNIVVVCVGGGQGGGGYKYLSSSSSYSSVSGSSGSASSFGSLVSASGGSGGFHDGMQLMQPLNSGSAPDRMLVRFGGVGEDGYWHTNGFVEFSITGLYTNKNVAASSSASTKPYGNAGSAYCSTDTYTNNISYYYTYFAGPGGLGYGAGGGGGIGYYEKSTSATSLAGYPNLAGRGGKAGTITTKHIKLTAEQVTTAFTITVGAGGAGAASSSSGNVLCGAGGGGARGVVGVYW